MAEISARDEAAAPLGGDPRWSFWIASGLCAFGSVLVGLSPIFVRLAEVGPAASALWRAGLALPALALWAAWEARRGAAPIAGRRRRLVWLAGAFFAGDLVFWHLSIHGTTLANASFITNSAPVLFIALLAWALLGDRPSARFWGAAAMAFAGASLLMGASVELDPANLRGDAFAIVTAVFFSAYVIALKAAGGGAAGAAAFQATVATTLGLAVAYAISGETTLLPETAQGWAALLALGLLCQAAGQGAIIASLRVLPAGVAAMLILIEPLTTVAVGWTAFGEPMSLLQLAGGALALAAIVASQPRRRRRRA